MIRTVNLYMQFHDQKMDFFLRRPGVPNFFLTTALLIAVGTSNKYSWYKVIKMLSSNPVNHQYKSAKDHPRYRLAIQVHSQASQRVFLMYMYNWGDVLGRGQITPSLDLMNMPAVHSRPGLSTVGSWTHTNPLSVVTYHVLTGIHACHHTLLTVFWLVGLAYLMVAKRASPSL